MPQETKQVVQKVKKQGARPTVSTVLTDRSVVEMVYRPEEHRTLFCVSKEGECRYEPNILDGDRRLVPYSTRNNLLVNDVVLFPSEASPYESEQELIESICSLIDEDTVLPAVPLWWRILDDERAQSEIEHLGERRDGNRLGHANYL